MDIPEFSEAVMSLRAFLAQQGCGQEIVWVFRDDLLEEVDRVLVGPDAAGNEPLVERVYAAARDQGLVELRVLAGSPTRSFVTVWFPRSPVEQVQGLNRGLKLSISSPRRPAEELDGPNWRMITLSPQYRRYQELQSFVGTKSWAAA